MSRFNTAAAPPPTSTNLAGGEAYISSLELELVSLLTTSFVKDQFYRSANETLERLVALVDAIKDKEFIAKAAIMARHQFGMRSVTHVVAGELAKHVKEKRWMRSFFCQVVNRPDDILEILAYYISKYGKRPLPSALKDGLGKAFDKFDEYQLAKYRAEGSEITLVDAVNLLHPKPTERNSEALMKLMKGELKSVDTWESKLTQAGQKAGTEEEKLELKADAWKELIETKKIAYFALLRNLRNILQQAPESLDDALVLLTDPNLIKKSKVLPFRFISAIEEIQKLPGGRPVIKIMMALNQAVDLSLANVPTFSGRTLIALDVSGSMTDGDARPAKIGALFAAALVKASDADLLTFDNTAKYQAVNPLDSTLTITKTFDFRGGGTDFHRIFEAARSEKYDRVIILSDMQGWMGRGSYENQRVEVLKAAFRQWKFKSGADPKVYSFDLAGYGTLQFPERNIFCLAGFSDKTFDILSRLDEDPKAMLSAVESIQL